MTQVNEITYRMEERGLSSLSDSETLSVAMGNTDINKVRKLLSQFNNNLNEIAKLSTGDLVRAGLTKREAKMLVAILEVGRRKQMADAEIKTKITCSRDMCDLMRPVIGDLQHEEFWIIFMNRANMVTGKWKASQGGLNGTVTDVRLILRQALEIKASCMILAHNHPSGNINPSESDTRVTQKVKEAGNIMDIQVLDHIIIGEKDYFSFADNGLL